MWKSARDAAKAPEKTGKTDHKDGHRLRDGRLVGSVPYCWKR